MTENQTLLTKRHFPNTICGCGRNFVHTSYAPSFNKFWICHYMHDDTDLQQKCAQTTAETCAHIPYPDLVNETKLGNRVHSEECAGKVNELSMLNYDKSTIDSEEASATLGLVCV